MIAKENNDFRNIFDNTGGIIFLACLNDEGYPGFDDVCLKCAAVEFGPKKKHPAVESLRKSEDWNIIKDVMESFRSLRCAFPVRTLYEMKTTNVSTSVSMFKGRKEECVRLLSHPSRTGTDAWKLCSEHISSLGWDNEQLIGLQNDHGELTMYPHRGDSQGSFETFMRTIYDLVDVVCPPAARPEYCSNEAEDSIGSWTHIPELSRNTSNLTIESSGKCHQLPT